MGHRQQWEAPRQTYGYTYLPNPNMYSYNRDNAVKKLYFEGSTLAESNGPDGFTNDWRGVPGRQSFISSSYYADGFLWGTTYYPTALSTGTYTLEAHTVGYVQRYVPSFSAVAGSSMADVKMDLVVGAEINVTITFRKEEIISCPDKHMWIRVKAFDSAGRLKAANITTVMPCNKTVNLQLLGLGGYPDSGFRSYHVSGSTAPPDGTTAYDWSAPPVGVKPQRIWLTWGHSRYWDPGDWSDRYDNYGLDAGTYDVVCEWLDAGSSGGIKLCGAINLGWPGLLQTAYLQRRVASATVSLGGKAYVFFDLHKLGLLSGNIYAFNWMGDLRTTSWIRVDVRGLPSAGDPSNWQFLHQIASTDGYYEQFLPEGKWPLRIWLAPFIKISTGYKVERLPIALSLGGVSSVDFYLSESGIPIPEFHFTAAALVLTLMLSQYLVQKARKKSIEE